MRLLPLFLFAATLGGCAVPPATSPAAPWQPDQGDGTYRNPVLHADYSDPDAIRVGDRYYMTASSFNYVPGLPLLTSGDLVNWTLVGHALPRLVPEAAFATPQFGKGVWAPCLRWHDGKFWIFYPDPDHGIYVITAENFTGPWSAPHLLLPGKGIIDPTPLWDDDGNAYLLHAWARSRSGINNVLTLRRMTPDARTLLDRKGRDIIDGNRLPGYRTLEGPKFYKAGGYYYVFAPAGGVAEGWQSVFRARTIDGPYEDRIVMAQGDTAVNGPHQGAWVRHADGRDWFLHFQDSKAYGRIVHLQPMRWADGWPVIGADSGALHVGQPVARHAKPAPGSMAAAPATTDEFDAATLGLQWQWNVNPQPAWHSLAARPGVLRLPVQGVPAAHGYVRGAPILSQKVPATAFSVQTHVELTGAADGDRAGLVVDGMQYAWLGLRRDKAATQLVYTECGPAVMRCTESSEVLLADSPTALHLRLDWRDGANVQFAYSLDGKAWTPAPRAFAAQPGRWVGATLGLFSVGDAPRGGYLDVDYFRVAR